MEKEKTFEELLQELFDIEYPLYSRVLNACREAYEMGYKDALTNQL